MPPPALGARYAWQAGRLAAREGRDGSDEKPWPTAQPYGINTPGAFAMVFSVTHRAANSGGPGGPAGPLGTPWRTLLDPLQIGKARWEMLLH